MNLAVRHTPRHTSLLTVGVLITGEEVDAIVDCTASAPMVGERLVKKMGVWKRAKKVNVNQGDGSNLSGENFVINISFQVF